MSEYQWIHFRAIDRPLDDDQLEFMQGQSTRADISRWEFTNEYHYGDFHGNTDRMLRSGYDVHLHFANFGVRKLMFRLPQLPCDRETFDAFESDDELAWDQDAKGRAGILTVIPEGDAGTWDYLEDPESLLDRIAPAREMLIRGDLRPLYLFWLATFSGDECLEPPVPAGLNESNDALDAITEFYEIPKALIDAAAETSPPLPKTGDSDHIVRRWVGRQSKAKLGKVVEELLLGEASQRHELLTEIRRSCDQPVWPAAEPSRTFGELYDASRTAERRREEAEEAARQEARRKELKVIKDDPQKVIRRIDICVGLKNRSGYRSAVCHLKDLGEALGDDFAQQHLEKMMRQYPRYTALREELRAAGFNP